MPKVTNILGNNKVPACESRDFVLKKKTVPKKLHFDTAPFNTLRFKTIRPKSHH